MSRLDEIKSVKDVTERDIQEWCGDLRKHDDKAFKYIGWLFWVHHDFLKSGFEETKVAIKEMKDDIEKVNDKLVSMDSRFDSMDSKLDSINEKLEKL